MGNVTVVVANGDSGRLLYAVPMQSMRNLLYTYTNSSCRFVTVTTIVSFPQVIRWEMCSGRGFLPNNAFINNTNTFRIQTQII